MGLAWAGAPRDGGLSPSPGGEAAAQAGRRETATVGIFSWQLRPSAAFKTGGPDQVSAGGSHDRGDGSHTAGEDETPTAYPQSRRQSRESAGPPARLPAGPLPSEGGRGLSVPGDGSPCTPTCPSQGVHRSRTRGGGAPPPPGSGRSDTRLLLEPAA